MSKLDSPSEPLWEIQDSLDVDIEEYLGRCYESEGPIEDSDYFYDLAKDSGVL